MILCGNSVLGMQFRTCRKFWESTDSSLVLSQNFLQIQKPHRNHFRCDSALGAESSKKIKLKKLIKSFCYFWLLPKVESLLPLNPNLPNNADSADSQNLVKNNPCEAPENSPASWCKKSDLRLQKCNRRFFARSGESEALPLKAKKRSFLARRGSGAGGAALFAKKTRELDKPKGDNFAESSKDYIDSQNLKGGLPHRFCESAHNNGNNHIA